jgi:hypothetical protein
MSVEQIMAIAERGKVNPSWLTDAEIRALALYLMALQTKH